MEKAREIHYITSSIPLIYRQVERLTTSRPITEELISSLKYLSEIEEVGLMLVQDHGHKNQQKIIYNRFQAFIQQGIAFYKGAEALDYRSAPLIYYYSFLNFAKAVLILVNPNNIEKFINHGLKHKFRRNNFEMQNIKVADGVFPLFYEKVLCNSIKIGRTLNISHLFGYIPEISYEHKLVGYGPNMYCSGALKVCESEDLKTAWPLFVILHSDKIDSYIKYFSKFRKYTQKVILKKEVARKNFGIDASVMNFHGFFESKSVYPVSKKGAIPMLQIIEDCESAIGYAYSHASTPAYLDYHIFMPYHIKNQISFDSLIATYVIMFYLGSLVRYNPHYFEKLRMSKHAWIIERFTAIAGIVFLSELNKLLHKKVLMYSKY